MRKIEIPQVVTVGELAEKLEIPVTSLIAELIKNGIMATVNERVDFETATLVLAEFMPEVELIIAEQKAVIVEKEARELSGTAQERPPIVAVMGHVDHGKTTLLDYIRGSSVAEAEAGGITQHISAYQITHNDRKVTFLDTPGHEAFAAIRQHGAKLTDVAIIVVAADDSVKPQTKEAIRFASQAGVKIIVAINKMDKPTADANRVKQDLANENILTDEWGGDIVTVEVSAKSGEGIDKLLDMVFLTTDIEELKADVDCEAEGLIIEAHMAKGKGAVATALIEHGVLKSGQAIAAGGAYARVRTLTGTLGEKITEAGPSTPVIITGFKTLPEFGDLFRVFKKEKDAKKAATQYALEHGTDAANKLNMTGSEMIRIMDKKRDQQEVPVIVKADVQGSLTSLLQSIQSLEHEEVKVRIVGSGVGNISENDVTMAEAVGAHVYGFNVELPTAIKRNAVNKSVDVKVYKVIYELLDNLKEKMSAELAPEVEETSTGRLIVKGVFRTTRNQVICGGEVTKGKVVPGVLVRVERDSEAVAEAKVTSVQRGKQEAKEVTEGTMCGLDLETESKIVIEEGDRLEFFTRELKERNL